MTEREDLIEKLADAAYGRIDAILDIHHEATRNALETAAAIAEMFADDPERSIAEQELARMIARLIRDRR